MTSPHSRIVFPLDVATPVEANTWCDRLKNEVGVMKVGLELFTAQGPSILEVPRARGFDIFLDLKLHDIPETVRRAASAAASHRVRFLTVHASGGPAMLKAAVEGAREGQVRDNSDPTLVLAVTVLTSMDVRDLDKTFGVPLNLERLVENMARMAWSAGVRGFVCSPLEVGILSKMLGPEATFVVPGIRPAAASDDQKRTSTPASAMKDGASYLVVGRPIRDAADPVAAARSIADAISPYVE